MAPVQPCSSPVLFPTLWGLWGFFQTYFDLWSPHLIVLASTPTATSNQLKVESPYFLPTNGAYPVRKPASLPVHSIVYVYLFLQFACTCIQVITVSARMVTELIQILEETLQAVLDVPWMRWVWGTDFCINAWDSTENCDLDFISVFAMVMNIMNIIILLACMQVDQWASPFHWVDVAHKLMSHSNSFCHVFGIVWCWRLPLIHSTYAFQSTSSDGYSCIMVPAPALFNQQCETNQIYGIAHWYCVCWILCLTVRSFWKARFCWWRSVLVNC